MKRKSIERKKNGKSKKPIKEEDEASEKKAIGGTFCQVCDKKLRSRYHLKIHMAVHTGEKSYICGICQKGYQQKWNLITHVARVHSKEKPFKCNDCGKEFGYSSHFKRHVKTHFLEKIDASDAVKNIILNPHKCPFCEKSFETNYRLDLHVRVHTGSRPYVCDKCGKSFTTKRLCAIHMRKHEKESQFVCEHCGYTFSNRQTIIRHLKTEHNVLENLGEKVNANGIIEKIDEPKKELVPCEVCGKKITRSSVKKHLNIHYRQRIYLCRYCKKEFLESGQRMVHERKHTGEKPYICDICGRGHSQYGNLLTHRKRYHNLTGKTPLLWKQKCRKMFENAKLHQATADMPKKKDPERESEHKQEPQRPKYTGNETLEEFLKIASRWVNKKFEETKNLKKTMSESSEPPPRYSPTPEDSPEGPENEPLPPKEDKMAALKEMKKNINKIIFDKIVEDLRTTSIGEKVLEVVDKIQQTAKVRNSDVLREFLTKMKGIPDNLVMRTKDGELFWHCWMCQSKLRSRHLLARHMFIHEPEENRPYKCDICLKTFTQSNNFKEHTMTHLNENQFYCEVCGCGFRHKSHFNAHKRRHDPKTAGTTPKKYECIYCGKNVATKYQKIEHERTHTREKPYLCKTCGHQFTTSSTLYRHQSTHVKASHQCTICLKLFKQKSSLKRHYETHSMSPFSRVSCECGKTFSQRPSLKKHKMICKKSDVVFVKPFECCVCEKKFLTKSDLKRHVATHDTSKKFSCPLCSTLLKSDETFKRHMRRHQHSETDKNSPNLTIDY